MKGIQCMLNNYILIKKTNKKNTYTGIDFDDLCSEIFIIPKLLHSSLNIFLFFFLNPLLLYVVM